VNNHKGLFTRLINLAMIRQCIPCNVSFKCKKTFEQHLKCKRHTDRIKEKSISEILKYECNVCGKKYSIRQSLHAHKKLNSCAVEATTPIVEATVEEKLVRYEKDRIDQNAVLEAMRQQIDVQQKSIESMQQKINLITILLQNGAGREPTSTSDSQCLLAQPVPQQQKRDKRKKISKDARQHVVNKQKNTCGECKLALTPYFEIDHIIGLQFGGTDDESNLMALCRECHAMKSIKENQCREQIKDAIQTIVRENLGINQRV